MTLALLTAVTVAAGKHGSKASHPAAKMAALAIGAVGPVMAKHTAQQVRKGLEKIRVDETTAASDGGGPADRATQADDTKPDHLRDTSGPEDMTLNELADALGVRQPPDPEALYRDGSTVLESPYQLPGNLASLPWDSLSRRNRFFVLVAAWALREADAVQALAAGRLEDAEEVFQECLIRAQYLESPELILRSYEDLEELAVASGDKVSARTWRAEIERITANHPGRE